MKTLRLLIGTYEENRGIWELRMDMESRKVLSSRCVSRTRRNSYLAVQDNICFAVSETPLAEGRVGSLHSFRITEDGLEDIHSLEHLPCLLTHLCINRAGTVIYTTSYGTGEILAVRVTEGVFGEILSRTQNVGSSVNPKRQTCAHPHSTWLAPDESKLYVCDLGTDEVLSWPLTEAGEICVSEKTRLSVPAGYGPRHMVFSADGEWAYVLCEMHYHLLVLRCSSGGIELANDISLEKSIPDAEWGGGAIHISHDGTTLFCSNRGKYSRVDVLSLINPAEPCWQSSLTDCSWPRDFCVTDEGQYVICANQTDDTLSFFGRQSGKMNYSFLGKVSGVPTPVCLLPI